MLKVTSGQVAAVGLTFGLLSPQAASSPLISVIRGVTRCSGQAGQGRAGVMGPGTRPRVLQGAFSGELAKIWARLEGPQEG